MRRVRKLKPIYEPPEGQMYHPYDRGRIAYNFEVQSCCKWQLIEKSRPDFGGAFPNWEYDPSYNWAEEVKAKRGKK